MIVVDEGPGIALGSYKQRGFITDGSSSSVHNPCESPRKPRLVSPETGTKTSGGAVSPPLLESLPHYSTVCPPFSMTVASGKTTPAHDLINSGHLVNKEPRSKICNTDQ
jgi:hypothetical protein